MRALPVLLALLLMAGCAEVPTDEPLPTVPPPAQGTLRGVVVDDAIRPLSNATVSITVTDGSLLNATTDSTGEFGFADLDAGAYVVRAAKVGYFEAQVTATVLATEETPSVRIVLSVDAAKAAYIAEYPFSGFLQCSATVVAARVAACNPNEALAPLCGVPVGVCNAGPGNLTEDRFLAVHTFDRSGIAFLQSEMVWQDTTGGLGKSLRAVPGARTPSDGKIGDYRAFEGESPLLMPMPGNLANGLLLGNGRDYIIRVFSGYMNGTAPPCLPAPVNCQWGVGAVANQRFEVFTHVFYNMLPPDDWQFGRDGLPPLPE